MAEPVLKTTFTCPQCGAENPLPSGERLVECAFCGATLYVDRSGLVSHYRLERLLDAGRAEAALRRWMAGNETVKGLDREARLRAPEPLLFPMWMFRLQQPGGEVVRIEPAAPAAEPRLTELQVPAGELRPYRTAPADGADPEGSAQGAPAAGADAEVVGAQVPLDTARRWLEQREGADPRVSETALVHLPLWRCEYLYRGASYSALVDGSTGAVLASHFPAKSEGPFWLVAGLGILVFLVEGFLTSNLLVKTALLGLTAAPVYLLAYWVARKI